MQELETLRHDEAARDGAAIRALLSDINQRRSLSLRELESHMSGRGSAPPEVVASVINRFVDEHMLQLDRALAVVEGRLGAVESAVARAPAPPIENRDPAPAAPARQSATLPGNLSNLTAASQPSASPPATQLAARPRKGFLFFSRTQPQRLDPVRISESDEIPLPPR
jgi:hypothetical protein